MKHIKTVTLQLATVSFLINTAGGIVFSAVSQTNFVKVMVLSRIVGDSVGYISKAIVGFLSDHSENKKKFLNWPKTRN